MKFVYILRSQSFPSQYYTGITENIEQRLKEHNRGKAKHTSPHIPWELVAYIAFTNHSKATAFERYMKTGSGRAFATKHFR